jgi:hypothetical protein
MQAFRVIVTIVLVFSPSLLRGQSNSDSIQKMEAAGDTAGAKSALARAAESNPGNLAAQTRYAEFLDRYGDSGARAAYEKMLAAARQSGDKERAATAARRLAVIDLLAGNNDAVSRHLDAYREASGKSLTLGAGAAARQDAMPTTTIPGPFRSFARMAAISGDALPEEVLPALARNVVTNGYQASHSNDALEQTEYLKLVHRYLTQARELEKLGGEGKTIKIEACESATVADLLKILGFRMRGGCGSEVVLETVNAARAFLTTDSGFPLNDLEQALRTNRPFTYDYRPTVVPVMFGPEYWLSASKEKEGAQFIDTFIGDPSMCRLYLGFAKLDRETADALKAAIAFPRIKVFAHVLDFFGGMFEIRGGKAIVPGGQRTAAAWTELAGASPDKGTEFFDKLISKDDGWLASLYDALARIHGPVQEYLTDPNRMKRFYTAVRGRITTPGPARPVFRSNTDMMLLTTRLRIGADGKPHIPGGLDVWKNLFVNHPQGKYDGKLTRLATTWKEPDDVIEALFALSRKAVENEPLKIFMAVSDLDRVRSKPLAPETVDRLAREYRDFGAQYSIFAESGALADASIIKFIDTAEVIGKIRDPLLRSDVAGTFQGLIGLWQIFVRQGTIPAAQADSAFSTLVASFSAIKNERELFDAGRAAIKSLIAAAPHKTGAPASAPQEQLVALLAGASPSEDADVRQQLETDIARILEAQRMVSVDALFAIADHLEAIAGKGEKLNPQLIAKLSSRIAEIQMPRASLTANEKNAMGFGYWTDKHIDAERKVNLRSAIEKAGADAEKVKDVRGLLAPFLRDSILALNYAHYAPPGAQILFTNPSFVRSHDFLGMQGSSHTWRATETYGTGWPSNAGGRLVGSLATLPYALAEAEQNFLIPAQTQALIWGDLVPQMILSAKIPRWWNVTPAQVHWVALHFRYGREALATASFDPALREQVLESLWKYAPPARTSAVARLLAEGDVKGAVERVTPSELYSVARDLAAKRAGDDSCILADLKRMAQASPNDINYTAVSKAFGTPKPTLANSYEPGLLSLRTFPALMGYSSRIMAESWESNALYWAALADETNVAPAWLNVRIPEWTQKLVEQIFASHLEDWPALLKSLRAVGDGVRAQHRAATSTEKASLSESPNNR